MKLEMKDYYVLIVMKLDKIYIIVKRLENNINL